MNNGFDIVFDRHVPPNDLSRALASEVGISASRVSVIHDIEQYPDSGDADIVCMVMELSGTEFVELVKIDSDGIVAPLPDIPTAKQLAKTFRGNFLISDDSSLSGYAMILITPSGGLFRVSLDADAMENREKYMLDSRSKRLIQGYGGNQDQPNAARDRRGRKVSPPEADLRR
jgi:hypothetical protein